MIFKRFYTESIAQASFLVGCAVTGEAAVVDATRDVDVYLDAAAKEGLRIVAVTETHIHADYVSGSRELAGLTGAKLYLSNEGGADWQYSFAAEPNVTLIGDGDEIHIGNIRLKAVHTPGHTPEHLSFLLTDGAATDKPIGAFTGDFIFAGDVGRPDLLEVAAGFKDTMRAGAETLFGSISSFKSMPDWLTLWPGHGAGSSCGKRLGGVPSTTLGYEKIVNPSLQFATEGDFVDDVLAGQPEPPKYFARMKRVNKLGPNPTRGLWNIGQVDPNSLPNAQLLDVRSANDFLKGSEKGAISIPMNASFSKWAGSLLALDNPIVILANSEQQAIDAAKALVLIGIENVSGWAQPTVQETLPSLDAVAAANTSDPLLDIRTGSERDEERIEGSLHIPLVYLADKHDLPAGRILVHCASGGRSVVGASYLRSQGIDAAAVVANFEDLQAAVEKTRAVGV